MSSEILDKCPECGGRLLWIVYNDTQTLIQVCAYGCEFKVSHSIADLFAAKQELENKANALVGLMAEYLKKGRELSAAQRRAEELETGLSKSNSELSNLLRRELAAEKEARNGTNL